MDENEIDVEIIIMILIVIFILELTNSLKVDNSHMSEKWEFFLIWILNKNVR